MNFECHYRPAASSLKDAKTAPVVPVEQIPHQLITDIVVNPFALDVLPDSLGFLANPDFLRKSAVMTVPTTGLSQSNILTPPYYGRAIPTGYGRIPIGNTLGRVVTQKGSWVGGVLYNKIKKYFSANFNHLGLLSAQGAKDDLEFSNSLNKHGFRAAFHLGYIILDEKGLKQWLTDKWISPNNKHNNLIWSRVIETSFQQVAPEGGPASLFRIGGSVERISGVYEQSEANTLLRRRVEMSTVARMFALENQFAGTQINRAFKSLDTNTGHKVKTIWEKMSERKKLQFEDLKFLLSFYIALYLQDVSSLKNMRNAGYSFDALALLTLKDLDIANFHYDFDTALESSGSTDYLKSRMILLMTYQLAQIGAAYLVEEGQLDYLSLEAEIRAEISNFDWNLSHK